MLIKLDAHQNIKRRQIYIIKIAKLIALE